VGPSKSVNDPRMYETGVLDPGSGADIHILDTGKGEIMSTPTKILCSHVFIEVLHDRIRSPGKTCRLPD
jgi:hypothetical protein